MRWLFLLSVVWLAPARAHHVLCVFPIPSRSHNHLAKGIVHALLDAGHEVTWATPYPGTDKKNLKFIDLSATQALSDAIDMTDERNRNAGLWFVKEFSRNISTAALEHQALKDAVVKGQYDAVVTEWFFSDVDAGYAAVQQVPWILLNGVVMHPYMEHLVDEVRSIPTHPLMFNDFPMPMTLIQRIFNSMMFVLMSVDNWLDYYSKEAYYTSKFGPLASARGVPLPPFSSALHNVSILLVNSHPSLAAPRSLPPNVIDVAGYHIEQETPPLPKDLQDLLDGSPQGVVYFSMGSVMKSSSLPERTQQALLKVFGGLPYTVLWKFEQELRGAPKNVHVRAWMPQASILAHPNVKLFITHGGLLSTLEATHYGVPLLAIPMFGDQHTNADRSVRAGVARRVTFSPDMAAQVKVEVEEMMTNDRYYKKAKQISKLFHDRPERPSKLVAHYVRLAIESKGAYHLRSPSKLYAWYERWLLDQLVVLALALGLVYHILRRALRALKNMLFKTNKQKRS